MIPAKAIRSFQRFFLSLFPLASVSLALASNPDVIKASRHDVSPPLSQMAVGASSSGGGSNSQTATARATGAMITNPNTDPVAAPLAGPLHRRRQLAHFRWTERAGQSQSVRFRVGPSGYEWRRWRYAVCADGERDDRGLRQVERRITARALGNPYALDRLRRSLRVRWRHADVCGWR